MIKRLPCVANKQPLRPTYIGIEGESFMSFVTGTPPHSPLQKPYKPTVRFGAGSPTTPPAVAPSKIGTTQEEIVKQLNYQIEKLARENKVDLPTRTAAQEKRYNQLLRVNAKKILIAEDTPDIQKKGVLYVDEEGVNHLNPKGKKALFENAVRNIYKKHIGFQYEMKKRKEAANNENSQNGASGEVPVDKYTRVSGSNDTTANESFLRRAYNRLPNPFASTASASASKNDTPEKAGEGANGEESTRVSGNTANESFLRRAFNRLPNPFASTASASKNDTTTDTTKKVRFAPSDSTDTAHDASSQTGASTSTDATNGEAPETLKAEQPAEEKHAVNGSDKVDASEETQKVTDATATKDSEPAAADKTSETKVEKSKKEDNEGILNGYVGTKLGIGAALLAGGIALKLTLIGIVPGLIMAGAGAAIMAWGGANYLLNDKDNDKKDEAQAPEASS
jgi:hypothetical protein